MNKITGIVAPVATAAMLLIGFAAPAHAGLYWNKKVKCSANDMDGRVIPTRWGNGEPGWNHFSGKHNIKRCDFLNSPIGWKVEGGRSTRSTAPTSAITAMPSTRGTEV
ncbi:hypothetical protein [Streptomyces sp. NPDC048442]|uniref:hypothetical protein n=1 Tax=Streptomyces sp. NPDC048442 TaxID=3154823 RepID=UPI00343AD4B7